MARTTRTTGIRRIRKQINPVGVTLRRHKGSTALFGPRFRGKNAQSALASARRFQSRFPKTKITFPIEFVS